MDNKNLCFQAARCSTPTSTTTVRFAWTSCRTNHNQRVVVQRGACLEPFQLRKKVQPKNQWLLSQIYHYSLKMSSYQMVSNFQLILCYQVVIHFLLNLSRFSYHWKAFVSERIFGHRSVQKCVILSTWAPRPSSYFWSNSASSKQQYTMLFFQVTNLFSRVYSLKHIFWSCNWVSQFF